MDLKLNAYWTKGLTYQCISILQDNSTGKPTFLQKRVYHLPSTPHGRRRNKKDISLHTLCVISELNYIYIHILYLKHDVFI